MKPIIIGIGGAHSGVGKTTFASLILRNLRKWGAIKYTKTDFYCSLTDDLEILSEEGKDTKKLLDAGAEKVIWIQSPPSELPEIVQIALSMLAYLNGIVIEGNSVIEVIKPDFVIFISGDNREFKKSAENVLKMADVIVYDEELPSCIPKTAKIFKREEKDKCLNFIYDFLDKFQLFKNL